MLQRLKRSHWQSMALRKVQAPPRFAAKAPAVGPDVAILMADDAGMGAVRAPGGPLATPALEVVARHCRGLA